MATLARPGRPFTPRVQRAYRLEMAGRTVVLLLTLLALTGLVVFYLGVLTGKGLRDPNDSAAITPAIPGTTPGTTPPAAPPAPAHTEPTALNQALQATTGQIEGLANQERAVSEQTQQLVARGRQQLALEDVPDKAPATPAAKPVPPAVAKAPPRLPAPSSASRPVPSAPAARAPVTAPAAAAHPSAHAPETVAGDGEGAFTVQVFSSPQQQHAQEILADLKKKGFPAYMNQFQAADKRVWYRVRVGKGTRAEADSLAAQIHRAASSLEPRVMKQ